MLAVVAAVLVGYGAYRRPVVPLSRTQRGILIGLRAAALLLLLLAPLALSSPLLLGWAPAAPPPVVVAVAVVSVVAVIDADVAASALNADVLAPSAAFATTTEVDAAEVIGTMNRTPSAPSISPGVPLWAEVPEVVRFAT